MGPVEIAGLIVAALRLAALAADYLRAHPEITADLSTLSRRLADATATAEATVREIRVPEAP